jgi:integrase
MKGHLRKRGDAWELRVYVGTDPITNRQKYVTRTFRGGKREAEEALARLVTEVSGGGHAAQDTTVGDLIREWLDLAKPELSPTTARGYEWIVKTYITPTLDKVPLARLRAAQLDRLYAKLRDEGGQDGKPLSAATVRQVHAILRRALQQGVRWGWLATNPAMQATPPRIRRPEVAPPEPVDVLKLIETADTVDPDLAAFLRTSVTTGARRGELCALRWRDLDLDGRTVTIAHNLVEGSGGELVEKDTKTHAARRIALDVTTVEVLQSHRRRMDERARACGANVRDAAYVFTRSVDGPPPSASTPTSSKSPTATPPTPSPPSSPPVRTVGALDRDVGHQEQLAFETGIHGPMSSGSRWDGRHVGEHGRPAGDGARRQPGRVGPRSERGDWRPSGDGPQEDRQPARSAVGQMVID